MKKLLFVILGVIAIALLAYFLKDKHAVLYLSSTADQDMDGKGISYAVFINKNGEASGYKMNGLELGGIGVSEIKKFKSKTPSLLYISTKRIAFSEEYGYKFILVLRRYITTS